METTTCKECGTKRLVATSLELTADGWVRSYEPDTLQKVWTCQECYNKQSFSEISQELDDLIEYDKKGNYAEAADVEYGMLEMIFRAAAFKELSEEQLKSLYEKFITYKNSIDYGVRWFN